MTAPVPKLGGEAQAGNPASRVTETLLIIAVSIAMLIPCIWLDHPASGDLGSHVYNAWLVTEIKAGAVQGLYLAHPLTNVLSDWALQFLLPRAGAAWAERIVVGIAVLVFFWGAFYFAAIVGGTRNWLLAPVFAMLAYGLVFNLGYLNFYLSTGLSLWILGLLWRPTSQSVVLSLPLWLLAILAHPMPVAWAAFVLAYTYLLRRTAPRMRPVLLGAGIMAVIGVEALAMWVFPHRWSLSDALSLYGFWGMTGVEQIFLSGPKYLFIMVGALGIGLQLFLQRLDRGGMMKDPLVHLWILQIAAFLISPAAVQFPQYQHVFAYIPQRLSLFNALIACLVIAGVRYSHWTTRWMALLATAYFTFFYLDSRAYMSIEQRLSALVGSVPPSSRVVAEIFDSNSRFTALQHAVDRPCIGRCFSYGNYEPASGQFRVRVRGPNPVVSSNMDTVKEIEDGQHVVTAAEAPIYSVCECDSVFCMRRLEAGQTTCSFSIPVSPSLGLNAK